MTDQRLDSRDLENVRMRCLVAVTIAALGGTAAADTIWVDGACGDDTWSGANPACAAPDGPKLTIQAAIGVAFNGDVVRVAPGTYRELINFLGKSIALRSSDGPEVTIINGDLDDDGIGDGTVVFCVTNETALTVLDGFKITGGQGGLGGGMLNSPGSPTVTNCIFRLNNATEGAGMFNGEGGSPTVTRCIFSNNSAINYGGGMGNRPGSSPTVTNCTFSNNDVTGNGGGMHNNTTLSLTVTNCVFTGNTAISNGGGIWNQASQGNPTVANCTFSKNAANGSGGAIKGDEGTFANCIFWGNTSNGVNEIDGTPTVTYSDVGGDFEGDGNINLNPMFVDPDNGDFHLSAGSPCIDAADNTAVPLDEADLDGDDDTLEPTSLDLDDNPRFVDDPATTDNGNGDPPIVDMGPYELQVGAPPCPWDLDGSGDVGITDFLVLLAQWGTDPGGPPDFDGDGNVSITDFLELLANWGPCP